MAESKAGINSIKMLNSLVPKDPLSTENTDHHHDIDIVDKEITKNIILAIILMISLTLHGFFEGAALGLEKSKIGSWNLFIGITHYFINHSSYMHA